MDFDCFKILKLVAYCSNIVVVRYYLFCFYVLMCILPYAGGTNALLLPVQWATEMHVFDLPHSGHPPQGHWSVCPPFSNHTAPLYVGYCSLLPTTCRSITVDHSQLGVFRSFRFFRYYSESILLDVLFLHRWEDLS